MKPQDDLTLFYQYIVDALQGVESKNAFPDYFYNAFRAGDRIAYQKYLSEIKHFDDEWIITLESYFPSISKIVLNPVKAIRYDEEVVPIERAKRITGQSVRHLASHTHLIRDAKGEEIQPKKIMTQTPEEEIGTYENRFIMTLINRLYAFVNNRYEVIKNNVESFQKHHVNFETHFDINDAKVDLSIDMVVKRNLDDPSINEHNLMLLERVEQLKNLVSGFKNSSFMKAMKGQKPVTPPIIKTNVLLKNVDFKNAHLLWLFIDRYHTLGYDVEVEERNIDFDDVYLHHLDQMALLIYSIVVKKSRIPAKIDASNITKYVQLSTQIAKDHPADFVENPNRLIMEDTSVNQYYLDKIKEIFEGALEREKGSGTLPDVALKRALRQTVDITNALYEASFQLEPDEDIFRRLVKEEDLEEQLRNIQERAKIAKMAREVKEVDYANAIRLERKLMKELEAVTKKSIRKAQKDKRLALKAQLKEKFIKEREAEIEKAKALQISLNEELERLNQMRLGIQAEHKELLQRIKETEKEIAKLEKERWEKEKAKLIAKEKAEREKARLKEQERLEKVRKAHEAKVKRVQEMLQGEKIKEKALQKRLEKKTLEQQKLEGKG